MLLQEFKPRKLQPFQTVSAYILIIILFRMLTVLMLQCALKPLFFVDCYTNYYVL